MKLRPALKLALSLVEQERVAFPLSAFNLMEFSKINKRRQREDLRALFLGLGRGWVVPARTRQLQEWVRYAIAQVFDRDCARPSLGPTRGVFSAFPEAADDKLAQMAPNAWPLIKANEDSPEVWDLFLSSSDDEHRREGVRRMTERARWTIRQMERRRQRLRTESASLRYRAYCCILFSELQDYYIRAMDELDVDRADLLKLSQEDAMRLTELVPGLDCEAQIAVVHERQWSKSYDPNDTYDVGGLFVAIPNCDAVFTENHWVTIAAQTHLPKKYECVMRSKTEQLQPILEKAT